MNPYEAPTISVREFWRVLTDSERDELRAFVDHVAGCYKGVTDVAYDVIDCPLLRVTRKVLDERGYAQVIPGTDQLLTETTEHLITAPLPSWWTPASAPPIEPDDRPQPIENPEERSA